jgi:succinoglycan biosynthesis protein ExoW
MRTAIVIPFYQRQPGILKKALASAFRQHDAGDFEIVVVDDSSPVPARAELEKFSPAERDRIRVIEQENGGPAAARNKGLDSLGLDVDYVAFLDSDDEWVPAHLRNALFALERGFDFYFADHLQLGQSVGAFKRAGKLKPYDNPKMPASDVIHRYDGDMFNQILTGNVIGTSTVVYNFRKFPQLRFREEFYNAGEDYLFWLDLKQLTGKFAFSSTCECTYGRGVNVYAGAGWSTEQSLARVHYEMKWQKAIVRLYALNARQKSDIGKTVKRLRHAFVLDVLHRITHRKPLDRALLKRQFATDPASFVFFLPLSARIVCSSLLSREPQSGSKDSS